MKTLDQIITELSKRLPQVEFIEGANFLWSHKNKQIIYVNSSENEAVWSLLHEASHAILKHKEYETDFELIKLESEAWSKAIELGHDYGVKISETYAQDCIDTYRDWLHQRSTCPKCTNVSLQQDSNSYRCFNCGHVWTVTSQRLCRPYRRSKQSNSLLA